MRVSQILGSRVIDRDGVEVGTVHDIRMTRTGPVQGLFGPTYVVEGLAAGPAAIGARLGFDRSEVRGPFVLKRLFRRLHRDGRFVEWAAIETVGDGVIRLRVSLRELPPIADR